MTIATNPKVNAAATMKAMAYSGFPASSLVHLHEELLSSDGNDAQIAAYRALFQEMQAQGEVPHERSILSPAAYFTDLLRMVLRLQTDSLPKSRQLLDRRPDLRDIPLDAAHTLHERPYLEFANALLRKLQDKQSAALSAAGITVPDLSVLQVNLPAARARAYLDAVGVDFGDVVGPVTDSTSNLAAAQLGIGADDILRLDEFSVFLDLAGATFPPETLRDAMDVSKLPKLLSQLGVADDVLDLLLGTKETVFANTVQSIVPWMANLGAVWFDRETKDDGAICWFVSGGGGPIRGHQTGQDLQVNDSKVSAIYHAMLGEILRFSHMTKALGISAAELDAVGGYFGDTGAYGRGFIDKLAPAIALARRFNIGLEEAVLILGASQTYPLTKQRAEPSLFGRLFPIAATDFPLDQVTADVTATAGINQQDAALIVQYLAQFGQKETAKRDVAPVMAEGAPTLVAVYRMHRLATLLDLPLVDLMSIAHLLQSDVQQPKDICDLIDYVSWIKAKKIEIQHLQAMAQRITTPTCTKADLLAVNTFVQGILAASKDDTLGTDETVEPALASFYGISIERFYGMCNVMSHAQELIDGFVDGVFSDLSETDDLEASPAVLGFCELQQLLAVTTHYAMSDALLTDIENVQDALGFSWPRKFCDIRQLRALSRLKDMSDARGYDVVERFVTTVLGAGGKDPDGALNAILGLSPDAFDAIKQTRDGAIRTCAYTALSDRAANVVEGMAWIEDLSKLATTLGVDLPSLIATSKLAGGTLASGGAQQDRAEAMQLADMVRAAVKGYDPSTWDAHGDAIEGPILEAERDQLVATLLWDLGLTDATDAMWPFGRPSTADDLSDVVLVDVQMGGASKISEIKLALNSLQRYIQRVRTGKEGLPVPLDVDEGTWTWRSHYRLWESNRKAFLFPENYLDPGLRRRKTPLFQDLEDTLLQVEIDDDAVTAAYMDYIDELELLTQLEIVGVCPVQLPSDASDTPDNVALVLGRTSGEKPEYYLRHAHFEGCDQLMFWHPWQPIGLPVHSREVVLGTVNGRLHLVWLDERIVTDQHDGERVTRTYCTMRYSYLLHSGTWSPARVWDDFKDRLVGTVTITKTAPAIAEPATESTETITFGSGAAPLALGLTTVPPRSLEHVALPFKDASGSKGPHFTMRLSAPADLQIALGDAEPDEVATPTWSATYFQGSPYRASKLHWQWSRDEALEIRDIVCWPGQDDPLKPQFCAILTEPNEEMGKIAWSFGNGEDDWSSEPIVDYFQRVFVGLRTGYTYAQVREKPTLRVYPNDGAKEEISFTTPEFVGDRVIELAEGHKDGELALILQDAKTGMRCAIVSTNDGATWTQQNAETGYPSKVCYGPEELGGYLFIAGPSEGAYVQIAQCYEPHQAFSIAMLEGGKFHGCGHFECLADGSFRIGASANLYHVSADGRTQTALVTGPDEGIIYDVIDDGAGGFIGRLEASEVGGDWCHAARGGAWQKLEEHGVWGLGSDNPIKKVFRLDPDGPLYAATFRSGLLITQPARVVSTVWDGGKISSLEIKRPDAPDGDRVIAFGSNAVQTLSHRLMKDGLKGLLSLRSQTDPIETAGGASVPIDFKPSAAFAEYYREIFFHIPYLIADTLNAHGKYEEAQSWYEHIFCPNLIGKTADPEDKTPYWRYTPFKNYELRHLEAFDPEEFTIYEKDPFDAHAIAAIRMGAYEKAVVMRYIDNLLDWGDDLFGQDSWESITLAMNHYDLARDLLGVDPRGRGTAGALPKIATFADLFPDDAIADGDPRDTFHLEDQQTFPIPGNTEFAGYWTRTADRLHKIRASEDIRGAKRSLALFQPPIDPRVVMAALASGMNLKDAAGAAASQSPIYRFPTLLARAKTATQSAISLGNALQATLEKKDAEGLAQLRANHDREVQKEVGKRLAMGQKAAQDRLDALSRRIAEANTKKSHFEGLLHASLLGPERLSIKLKNDAFVLSAMTAEIRSASAAGYAVPCIFGFSNGGQDIGKVIESAAGALDSVSGAISQSAGMAESRGQTDRRKQDWLWQIEEAKAEIARIQDEIRSAQGALEQAAKEMELHESSVARSDAIATYVSDKFTNKELYTWLSTKLSALVSTSFRFALDLARDAEAAHRWERCDIDSHISAPDVASKRGSLVAGQELLMSLARLERAYMDGGKRQLQYKKTISLATAQTSASLCQDWSAIRSGSIDFTLPAAVFATDGAGDVHRRIRSVAVTLPAIVGPYQSVGAILKQKSHTMLVAGKTSSVPSGEEVAISTGVRDHGVHELDFKGETYQPFEGRGLVSDWRLSLHEDVPQEVRESISDVILHIEYVVHPI
jgi:hypothetical protein